MMKPLLVCLLLFQNVTITTPPNVITIPLPAIDYGQLSKQLRFRRGFVSAPDGIYVDDTALLKEMVLRVEPTITPGQCRIGTDGVLGSNAFVKTPKYLYLCVPNPAGPNPFQWARVALTTKW